MLDDKDEFVDPVTDLRRARQRFYYWDKKYRRAGWRAAYWRKKIRKLDAQMAETQAILAKFRVKT